MSQVSENIRFLRKKSGFTQATFANRLGIKRSLVGAYEEGRAEVRLHILVDIARLFAITLDDLITADVSVQNFKKKILVESEQLHHKIEASRVEPALEPKIRVEETIAGRFNEGNVSLIKVNQRTEYIDAIRKNVKIDFLTRFSLPSSEKKHYKAFEILDNSMLANKDGVIVFGNACKSIAEMISGDAYILVSISDGVVFRRLIRKDAHSLHLIADNKDFSPSEISINHILEVIHIEGFINYSLPALQENQKLTVERLANVVINLQQEIIKLQGFPRS